MKKSQQLGILTMLVGLVVTMGFSLNRAGRTIDKQERAIVKVGNFPENVLEILEYKNLQSRNFPQGFSIKVKNISGRPIFFIGFDISLTDFKADGAIPVGMYAYWGRRTLIDYQEPIKEEDKVVQPDEVVEVMVSPQDEKNLFRSFKNRKTTALKLELFPFHINFGDQTGYQSGKPRGKKISQVSTEWYGVDCTPSCFRHSLQDTYSCALPECIVKVAVPDTSSGICSSLRQWPNICYDDEGLNTYVIA